MERKVAPETEAITLTSVVLLHPGGPNSKIPLGGFKPSLLNVSLCKSGHSVACLSFYDDHQLLHLVAVTNTTYIIREREISPSSHLQGHQCRPILSFRLQFRSLFVLKVQLSTWRQQNRQWSPAVH